MPSSSDHPAVHVEQLSAATHPIVGLATGIPLFVGAAASGPRGVAIRMDGPAPFAATFGAPDATHGLGDAVVRYFANGGRVAWVIAIDAGPADPAAFAPALLACFDAGGPVDAIDRFDLLCVPGLSHAPTQAALQACCATRRVFYIADCAADATAPALAAGPDPLLVGAHAGWMALIAPWVIAADAGGTPHAVPPSPFVAGLYARTDLQRGVWKAPAGVDATLVGATALATPLDRQTADAMNDAGIDALRVLPGHGVVAWGARTLASGSDATYRYVSVRRLLLYLESSVVAGLQWTVFEPNAEPTWAAVRSSVTTFLLETWRNGALAGTTFEQAAFVRCDGTTMTQADIDEGRLIVEIGVAPLRPAEFVVLRVVARTVA